VAVYRDERSPEHPRYSKRLIESYHQTGLDRNLPQLERIYGLDPDWCELFMQFIRGGLYSREVLSQATREIIACGALACLDKQEQLRSHLQTGVAFGALKEHLLEAIFQSVVYGGFPATHNSLKTFSELFPDMVKHDRPAVPASEGEPPRGPAYEPAYENAVMMYGQEYADGIVERFNGWDPDFGLLAQAVCVRGHLRSTSGRSKAAPAHHDRLPDRSQRHAAARDAFAGRPAPWHSVRRDPGSYLSDERLLRLPLCRRGAADLRWCFGCLDSRAAGLTSEVGAIQRSVPTCRQLLNVLHRGTLLRHQDSGRCWRSGLPGRPDRSGSRRPGSPRTAPSRPSARPGGS
jgi:alkylhydroperoxidase/carboxymuconolactone decarboxylase family protein YurZ